MFEASSPDDSTILHQAAGRAIGGDLSSLQVVVERLSPLLEANAALQIRDGLGGVDPRDIVNTVWEKTLPKLHSLTASDGKCAVAILRFANKVLSDVVVDLLRFTARRRQAHLPAGSDDSQDPILRVPDDHTSVFSRVVRDEEYRRILRALEELPAKDREVLFHRALDGLPHKEIGALIGATEEAATKRYVRTVARLRARITGSTLAILPRS